MTNAEIVTHSAESSQLTASKAFLMSAGTRPRSLTWNLPASVRNLTLRMAAERTFSSNCGGVRDLPQGSPERTEGHAGGGMLVSAPSDIRVSTGGPVVFCR